MAGKQRFFNKPQFGARLNHAHPYTKGLVGMWLFNEGSGIRCVDSSIQGNDGTMVGFGVPANSRSIHGLNLNGSGYINVPNSMSLNSMNQITITAWFKTSIDTTRILSKRGATPNSGYMIYTSVDKKLYVGISISNTFRNVAGSIVTDGLWHFGVGTYDGYMIKMYVDGVLRGSGAFTGSIDTNLNILSIGNEQLYANLFYNGNIDDVRIYNRALNASEIKEQYINPYPAGLFV